MITKDVLEKFVLQHSKLKGAFNKAHDGENVCRYFSTDSLGFWPAKHYVTHCRSSKKTLAVIEYNNGIIEISFTIYDVLYT